MHFMMFEICTASGDRIPEQHPYVYIATHSIARIVKQPDQDNITYLDLGETGVWVKGDFNTIASMLNAKDTPIEWAWPERV